MEDGEERLGCILALSARGLPDCSQVECSGGGNRVVEAYERQVRRYPQAEVVGRAERALCEPVAETEEGGRAGDLREDGRRAGFAFLRCAVGALVNGDGTPLQTVPFGRVPVAGEAIARHGVGGGALCRDINQTSDRAAMQGETHDSDPAMSKLEYVIGRLGCSKPVGDPDPGHMWCEAIELGWAALVDDHQRQPAYGCHFEDRIIVGQRGGDEAINHSATDGRSPLLIGRGTRQEEQPDTCRLDDARDTGKAARRGALAAWSASGAAAGAMGFLVGGLLAEILGWRAVFWVTVPVGLLLVAGIRLLVPPSTADGRGARVDLVGASLLVAAVMALIVGASLVEDPARRTGGGLLAVAGLVVGATFVAHQRRARNPLVPQAAFASTNLRTGTVVSFVNTATTSSAGVLATLFLQGELGISPVGAGLVLMPFSVAVIVGSMLTKPLGARLPAWRLAAAGLAGIAAGNLLLAATYGSIAGIVGGVAVAGVGLGVASVAATAIGTDVAETLGGTSSGLLNAGAQLGTAVGVAVLLVLAASVNQPWPGTAQAWIVAAAIAGATALSLLIARRGNASRADAITEGNCRPASSR